MPHGHFTSGFNTEFIPAHGPTVNLLNLLVNPGCRLPVKKYVLGSTSGVLIQVLDVNPFPKISDAHKDVKLPISESDGMRNVAA